MDGGWGKVDDGWCVVEMGHGVGVQMFVRLDVSVWCNCRCVVGDILCGLLCAVFIHTAAKRYFRCCRDMFTFAICDFNAHSCNLGPKDAIDAVDVSN